MGPSSPLPRQVSLESSEGSGMNVGSIFLHGLESSGQGHKARLIGQLVPGLVCPDFTGSLEERMGQLEPWLAEGSWMVVGSSFGGLMAALWARANPTRVHRLILLAPALHRPDFDRTGPPLAVPTLLVHGTADTVVPPVEVRDRASRAFSDLTVWWVDDDHRLTATSQSMDWVRLLDPQESRPFQGGFG